MATNEEEMDVEFTPRPYQIELYRLAKEENTIVCLGTGTGKTFIAILLMRDPDFASQLKGDYRTGCAKRTFFLVPTRPLVRQQANEIQRHFAGVSVKGFTGDMNVDYYDEDEWTQELADNQVLVMTPQILLNMLSHSYIHFKDINLLIIDEVHWAAKKKGKKESGHPYKQIMNIYAKCPPTGRPRVLGLSASLINSSMRADLFDLCIKDLEETYCSTCNTSDVKQLCGTHPKEHIWTYVKQPSSESPIAQTVVIALDNFVDFLKAIKENKAIPMSVTRIRKCLKNIRNMLSDPVDQMVKDPLTGIEYPVNITWMGVWCASIAIDKYVEEMTQYKDIYSLTDPKQSQLLDCIIKFLTNVIKKAFEPEVQSPESALNTASPKMHRLLELLRRYKPIGAEKSQLCGIVFVNQRSVAKVLTEWLTELKRIKPLEYGFLNVGWVVGHSARPGFESLVTSFTDRQQQEIIDKFRSEELNLLVSTSVLEEGLDVRQCNLIIRYDKINTFREYLQSKGRARADDAYYYVMASDVDTSKVSQQLMCFRVMEKKLENLNNKQTISGKYLLDDDESGSSDEEEIYMSSGTNARITSRTAISLLYRYCGKLTTDSFTKLMPIFDIKEEISQKNGRFRCSVRLPINSPLKDIVYGKLCKTKKGSKKSAAMEACKRLYELGELNNRFLPINRQQFIDKYIEKLGLKLNREQIEETDKCKVGTKSRTQLYPKQLAQVFNRSPIQRNVFYLNEIRINYPKIDCFRKSRLTFGAITSQPIVNCCSFPVFVNIRDNLKGEKSISSEAMVNLIPLNEIVVNVEQKKSIEKFHCFTFAEVLSLEEIKRNLIFKSFESDFNLLIVPLMNGSEIDYHFMKRVNNFDPTVVKSLSTVDRMGFTFDAQLYEDCVFYPSYRSDVNNCPQFYDCIKISDFNAKSEWKDSQYENCQQYIRAKYSIEICNKNQPLLEGRLVKKCSQITPFLIGKATDKQELFPPELLHIHPFPSSLWRQALCLPAILYRVNHILLAEELRQRIEAQTKPSIRSLDSMDKHLVLKSNTCLDTKDWTLNENKRVHNNEDFEDGCEGHPFDFDSDCIPSMSHMKKKKKKEENYTIRIESGLKSRDPMLTNNFNITGLSDIELNSRTSLIRKTDAIIHQFGQLIKSFQITPNYDINLEQYQYSPEHQVLLYGDAFPYVFEGDIRQYIREKYDQRVDDPIRGPTADVLLRALTLLNASDAINLERLETIGDSFLKFVTTAFLYYSCPELDEGRLSYLRQIQICNCNLFYIGCEKKISEIIVSNRWYPHKNWLPPGYDIEEDDDCCRLTDETNTCGAFRYHSVNDKSIADSIEALIGAHLIVGGNKSALIFMEWLGLKVTPSEHTIDYLNVENRCSDDVFQWLPTPKNPIWNYNQLQERQIIDFIHKDFDGCNLDHFEDTIGYKFNNKAFLIQAFTHSSYYLNEFTDCYQKLEFFGDSILDYLITRHIFSDPNKKLSPGELTDLRSALVNNAFFASIAVKFNFHKYLKVLSPELFKAIDIFVKKFEKNKIDVINDCFNVLTDEDCCDPEEIEVPKALGDIFESVAGAVFLDNGLSLDGVWNVFFKLLKPEIDYFSEHIPKMPVRELREKCSQVLFGKSEPISGRKIRVEVTADGIVCSGVGKNKKFAKIAASKKALRSIKSNKKV